MNTIVCPGAVDRHCGEEIEAQNVLVEHLVSEHGYERCYAEELAIRSVAVNDQVREILASLRGSE